MHFPIHFSSLRAARMILTFGCLLPFVLVLLLLSKKSRVGDCLNDFIKYNRQ